MNKHTHIYIYIHIKISYINENFEITVARMDCISSTLLPILMCIYIYYT